MGLFNKKEKSYEEIVNEIHSNLTDNKEENIKVETGIFGADMKVSLINDGPITIMLEK